MGKMFNPDKEVYDYKDGKIRQKRDSELKEKQFAEAKEKILALSNNYKKLLADPLANPEVILEKLEIIEDSSKNTEVIEDEPEWDVAYSYPKMHPDAYYGVLGDLVKELAPHTEADPAAIFFQLLTGVMNMVGFGEDGIGPHVRIGNTVHHSRLFTVIVGKSGKARKGDSSRIVINFLKEIDAQLFEKSTISGFASGEAIVAHLSDKFDEEGDPIEVEKRLLILEPEFAGVLAASSREGSILSQIIRNAYDGSRLENHSIKNGARTASDYFLSAIGHITQEELQKKLDDVEIANGFANRFMFVCAQRTQLKPVGGTLPYDKQLDFAKRLRKCVKKARKTGMLTMTPEAFDKWCGIYRNLIPDEPGMAGSLLGRAETNILRIAIALAALDDSEEDNSHNSPFSSGSARKNKNENESEEDNSHNSQFSSGSAHKNKNENDSEGGNKTLQVKHLISSYYIYQYIIDSTHFIFQSKLSDFIEKRLLEAARENYENYLNTGLDRAAQSKLFSGHKSKEEISAARERLISSGLIREEQLQGSTKPRYVIFANTLAERKSENYENYPNILSVTRDPQHDNYDEYLNAQKSYALHNPFKISTPEIIEKPTKPEIEKPVKEIKVSAAQIKLQREEKRIEFFAEKLKDLVRHEPMDEAQVIEHFAEEPDGTKSMLTKAMLKIGAKRKTVKGIKCIASHEYVETIKNKEEEKVLNDFTEMLHSDELNNMFPVLRKKDK